MRRLLPGLFLLVACKAATAPIALAWTKSAYTATIAADGHSVTSADAPSLVLTSSSALPLTVTVTLAPSTTNNACSAPGPHFAQQVSVDRQDAFTATVAPALSICPLDQAASTFTYQRGTYTIVASYGTYTSQASFTVK